MTSFDYLYIKFFVAFVIDSIDLPAFWVEINETGQLVRLVEPSALEVKIHPSLEY